MRKITVLAALSFLILGHAYTQTSKEDKSTKYFR